MNYVPCIFSFLPGGANALKFEFSNFATKKACFSCTVFPPLRYTIHRDRVARHRPGQSADVGGEQYGTFFGHHLDTGRVGGDEDCLAPAYALGVAFGVLYGGFPGCADEDEERAEGGDVLGKGTVDVEERGGEILAVHEEAFLVLFARVGGAVVGLHGVVDSRFGQFGVQLAGLAVEPEAAEVVNPVGDVGGLLHLGDRNEPAPMLCIRPAGRKNTSPGDTR